MSDLEELSREGNQQQLPDDIDALLGHERRRGGPSPEQAARLSRRLLALVPSAPASPTPPSPAPSPPLPSASQASSLSTRALQFIAVFALGAGTGAALHAALMPEQPGATTTAHEPEPVPSFTEREQLGPIITPREDVPIVEPVSPQDTVIVAPPQHDATDDEADAARDLALIERARVALGRGQSGDALRALSEHRRRFPHRSEEEREALTVQAFAANGQHAEARADAHAFLERYPRSLFRAVVAPLATEETDAPPSIP